VNLNLNNAPSGWFQLAVGNDKDLSTRPGSPTRKLVDDGVVVATGIDDAGGGCQSPRPE
jgi:hypothetical protein